MAAKFCRRILYTALIPSVSMAADARSGAMGNAGVASADYVAASFYNPALLANPDQSGGFGLIASVTEIFTTNEDKMNSIKNIEQFNDEYDISPEDISSELIDQVNRDLNSLNGKGVSMSTVDGSYAVAIPNSILPISFFMKGEFINVSGVNSAHYISDSVEKTKNRIDNSSLDTYGYFGADYGVTFAQTFSIAGEAVSFGVSPKLKIMGTYTNSDELNSEDPNIDNNSDIQNHDYGMNLDIGAVWYRGPWRMAFAVIDIIKQKVDVTDEGHYEVTPQATLGASFTGYNYIVTADIDLNKQEHFSHLDDETQFVRIGAEYGTLSWVRLRVGYEADLEDTVDNILTMGVGFSPWQVAHFDLTASYNSKSTLALMVDMKITI